MRLGTRAISPIASINGHFRRLIRYLYFENIPRFRRRIQAIKAHPFVTFAFAFFGILFGTLIFLFFYRAFGYMISLPDFTRPFVLGFIQRLLTALLVALSFLVFLSGALNTLTLFYLSDETEIHWSLPIPRFHFVLNRTFRVYFQSTYMVFLTFIPVILAFTLRFQLPAPAVPIQITLLALLFFPFVAFSQVLTALLIRWFPARRLHQFLLFLTATTLVFLLLLLRISRPERFLHPLAPGDLMELLQRLTLPGALYWPQSWVSILMIHPFTGRTWDRAAAISSHRFTILLLASPIFLFLLRSLLTGSYPRARESLTRLHPLRTRFAFRSSSIHAWLLAREWWFFSRDPTQWGQLMLLSAVLLVYFFNIRLIPIPHPSIVYFVWLLNTAMMGFILSALAARFVLPSFSFDGPAAWIIYVLPFPPDRVYQIRWAFYQFLFTILAIGMTLGSLILLRLNHPFFLFLNLLLAVTIAFPITALALNLSVRFRTIREHHPLQMALTAPGLLFMLASMAWIALSLLAALPRVWFRVRARFWQYPEPSWPNLVLLGYVTLTTALVYFTTRDGIRRSRIPPHS